MLGHLIDGGRDLCRKGFQLIHRRNVDDERIVLGTALCLKDPQNGVGIQCVGRQTVDRFGGNAHHLALTQQFARFLNVSFGAAQQLSLHTCRSNARRSCPWISG